MGRIHCARDVLVIDPDDATPAGVIAVLGHGSDLLDRALAGWERFLVSFEGVTDE
ncbi:hypothetical protein ACIPUC_26995 [Streptomyces sp. LARHCF249]